MARFQLPKLLSLACLLVSSVFSFSQVSNDVCSNATVLSPSTDTTCNATQGSFAGALQENAPSACAGLANSAAAFDQWFKFTANDPTQVIDVTTLGGGGGPGQGVGAVVILYDACGGTEIACGNPNAIAVGPFVFIQSGLTRVEATGLTAGNDYYIRVYNWGDSLPPAGSDLFTICVHQAPMPPANDVCNDAVSLTVGSVCVPTDGTLAGAVQENAPTACGTDAASASAKDVWYSFVANQSNEIIEVGPKAFSQGAIAPVVEVYESCGGNQLACANPQIFQFIGAIPGTTTLIYDVYTPGSTYYVRVFNYGDDVPTDGNFTICVYDAPPAPANDSCSNAIALTVHDTCNAITGTVVSATQDYAPEACDGATADAAYDVWYNFVAENTKEIVEVNSNDIAPVVGIYDACGGNLIACGNPGGGFGPQNTTVTASGLTIGNTYIVRVYNDGSDQLASGDFTICVYNPEPAPVNDTCSGAIIVIPSTADTCTAATPGNLQGANEESPAESCGPEAPSPTANDVWYKFTANASVQNIEVTSPGFGNVIGLYESNGNDCGSLLECKYPTLIPVGPNVFAAPGTNVLTASGLTTGNTYFVRVYAYGNGVPNNNIFSICIYKDSAASVGITPVQADFSVLQTYPNPVKNELQISFTSNGSYSYKLMDITGKVVASSALTPAVGSVSRNINTANLPKGLYLLQVTSGSQTATKKLVKE